MPIADARVLDHDPVSGITEYYHYDSDTDGFLIETVQDVSGLLDDNVRLWSGTEKHTRWGEMAHVARFPMTVVMELAKQGIMTPAMRILDEPKYTRWLNDPENLKWRVRMGRV